MGNKRTKPEAYREMYTALADELGSHYAANLIADTNPGKEVMISIYSMFTQRTGVTHDLDPMREAKMSGM